MNGGYVNGGYVIDNLRIKCWFCLFLFSIMSARFIV